MDESQSSRPNQLSWVGRTLGGRYQIVSRLGSGGMSTVYKAQDPNLQRAVAIKIIHPHLSENPEFVKRFEQEAAAVAQLRHPNIMQVHDFDHDEGVFYIVFEYIPGQPLDQKLKELKEASILMPIQDVINIMLPLCEAVAYAHGRKMIHRDLKPSNVIINLLNQPILLDFGIAKMVGSDSMHTATGATMGTAAYMPPEQVMGEEVDHRADIYSLGIMLYEMAAGQPPFEGHSAMTVMMKHVNEPLPDVRLHNSNLPATFTFIAEKALAKKPINRFDSATEMAAALRQVEQQLALSRSTTQSFVSTAVQPPSPPPALPEAFVPQPVPETAVSPPAPETLIPQPESIPTAATPQTARKKRPVWLLVGGVVLTLLALAAAYFMRQNGATTVTLTSQGMAAIPAGTYTVGTVSNESGVAPEQSVALAAYWLDRYEATNADYSAYIATSGAEPPDSWNGANPPADQDDHPVQGLTWQMAADYCQAQGKRLPTEAEWEVAARGEAGLLYAWGNTANAIALPASSTYAVGTIPANRSPFGLYDMTGNVWEWVAEPYTAVPSGQAIARGGAYNFLKDLVYRLQGDPTVPTMFSTAGVRCAASEVEIVPDDDLLFQDDFTDETSGWPVVQEGSVLSGYHPPDYYHVQAGQPNQIATAFFGGNFTDIGLETNVFVDSTDTETGDFRYGLIVRRNGAQFYAFTVAPRSQKWAVLKAQPDSLQTLAEGDLAPLSNTAAKPDRLRVDASGETFLFFVDGELIAMLKDPSYPAGDVGFYVETFDEERAHVHYDLVEADRIANVPDTAVILEDDFTDPNSGWPETSEGAVLSGYHPPDYYHVQSGAPNQRSTAFFDGQMSDFTLETDVFVEATDTEAGDFYYGIVVRGADETEYALLVSPRAGQWQVVKTEAAGDTVLGSGADDSLQGETASDHLRLDAAGEALIFHVNGRPVLGVEEVASSPYSIGFVVQTLDETRAHIHYDVLRVREAAVDMAAVPTVVAATDGEAVELVATAVAEVTPTATPEPAVSPTLEPTPEEPIPTGPLPSSLGMVRVDAGDYSVGTGITITIPEFWIDRTEVSNAAYGLFVTDTGQIPPPSWVDGSIPAGLAEHPVQGVTWETAVAYCNWANKRLPTEAEWEVAARGPHAALYPWGDNASAVKLPNNGTYAVGTMAQNRSYFGVYDMAGNVWEWVADPFNTVAAGEEVIRGGAYNFAKNMTEFVAGKPDNDLMFSNTGIRCAATAVTPEPDATALLADDFSDTLSGWYNARAPIGPFFYGYHPTDFYHVQVSAAHSCLTVYRDLPIDNFTAEAQIFIAATDDETGDFRYGLIAREDGKAFYAFTISPRTQTWKVLKSTASGLTLMDEGEITTLSGIDQAHRDRLAVTGEGPTLTFFVNGELVSQVIDADYAQGNVGFIVETLDETYAHIHYDSIEVRPLLNPTATPATNAATSYPIDTPSCQGSVNIADTLVQFTTHTVAEGQTLDDIGKIYNVTQADILAANGKAIDNPNVIRIGQTIIIPQG